MGGSNGKSNQGRARAHNDGPPTENQFKKGTSGNPNGRPAGLATAKDIPIKFAPLVVKCAGDTADQHAWTRSVANRLFAKSGEELTDEELKKIPVSQLVVSAALFNACQPKGARFFSEIMNRIDGKVPDRVEVEGNVNQGVHIAMFPVQPPEGWYEQVRGLIGQRPGDPLLPGEVVEQGGET